MSSLGSMTSRCSKCKQHLPVDCFHRNRSTKNGLSLWCRDCTKLEYHKNKGRKRLPDNAIVKCPKCQRDLTASCFSSNQRAINGLCWDCKECQREKNQQRAENDRPPDDSIVQCSKCERNLPANQFHAMPKSNNGLTKHCKDCTKIYYQQKQPSERISDDEIVWCIGCELMLHASDFGYSARKSNGLDSRCRQCIKKKAESRKGYRRKHYLDNREATAEYHRGRRAITREYARNKYTEDPMFRIRACVSSSIRRSLKNGKDGLGWESLVGYSREDLVCHLEKQFTEGMTWDNYGGWHIDHIQPISAFNFEKAEDIDFKRCWALSNLQPLWATDNHRKSDRIDKPIQQGMIFE